MLERDFLAFINANQLFEPTNRILLAVSGGLDSVVMAELFHRIQQPFAIAHVNFGLRGDESDEDALLVKNKAEHYGVPFHLISFDTTSVAAEQGVSIQMAARKLRYDWFAQLCQDHKYASVATAHHQNDVLETMLLNLTRGTGIAGLHGIASKQNGIVRPLLFATRERLTAYLDEQKLTYREDRSNLEDKYARNRIRHHVVPVLTALNPALWQTLPRTIERLRAAEKLMQTQLSQVWQNTAEQRGNQTLLPTAKLVELPEIFFYLTEWLKPFGFTEAQVQQMITSLNQPVGQVFSSATHRIAHERKGLLLESISTLSDFEITISAWPDKPIRIANQFTLEVSVQEKPTDFVPSSNSAIAYLNADQLNLPLTIRPWRQGDRFRPLGMKGQKLVSDLLNELKLTRTEREQTAVLLSGNEIAWVIGRRISHSFRVTPETQQILRLSLR
ncbi:tRNA lysidine(34) synthetase TilS [Spirosoma harenae]